jgi:hypothetical protein
MFLHEDAKCLLETNDQENLPIEYGGKLELPDIIEKHFQKLEAKRDELLLNSQMALNLELYPKCVRNLEKSSFKRTIEEIIEDEKKGKHVEFEEVRVSFKKLEFD